MATKVFLFEIPSVTGLSDLPTARDVYFQNITSLTKGAEFSAMPAVVKLYINNAGGRMK